MSEPKFEPFTVNVRIQISALWTSMLFVFAYVDLLSLYRSDYLALLAAIVYYAWTWPRETAT